MLAVDIRRAQDGFLGILARARIIIVKRRDIDLRKGRSKNDENQNRTDRACKVAPKIIHNVSLSSSRMTATRVRLETRGSHGQSMLAVDNSFPPAATDAAKLL